MSEDERLYWEDFQAGDAVAFGAYEVTAEEIVAYGREFDPQSAHLDPSVEGGLVASDWHACAMLMRMLCDDYLMRTAGAGAPGVEFVRWAGSVRPGDVLNARRTPLEVRASKSRPRIGIVRLLLQVFNQKGEEVLSWCPIQLIDRRDPEATLPPPEAVPEEDIPPALFRTPPELSADRAPAARLRFADIEIGSSAPLGSHVFSTENMLGFATRYNPQYFHADIEKAAASLYGGLIASGWHTASVWNRLFITHHLKVRESGEGRAAQFGPSIAIVDMKWPAPVRPGDEITYRTQVVDKRDDPRFPEWGIVISENEGANQRGEVVLNLRHEIWVEK